MIRPWASMRLAVGMAGALPMAVVGGLLVWVGIEGFADSAPNVWATITGVVLLIFAAFCAFVLIRQFRETIQPRQRGFEVMPRSGTK